LGLRHLAKIAEGTGNKAPAVFREPTKLLHGTTNLLALRRRETFHCFGTVEDAATLLWRHIIELRQAVAHSLLSRWGEVAKARLVLKSALLFRRRKIAMALHPLRQVFLIFIRSWT
jgi:hypothetical protein